MLNDRDCIEHLIALLTSQCLQIPLTPRMFPLWDSQVRNQKTKLDIGQFYSLKLPLSLLLINKCLFEKFSSTFLYRMKTSAVILCIMWYAIYMVDLAPDIISGPDIKISFGVRPSIRIESHAHIVSQLWLGLI